MGDGEDVRRPVVAFDRTERPDFPVVCVRFRFPTTNMVPAASADPFDFGSRRALHGHR